MIKKILNNILISLIRNYKIINDEKYPYALISYLPFPYRINRRKSMLNRHQNRLEAIEIGNVFSNLGYNIDIVMYNRYTFIKKNKYKIIFGLEPNFERASKNNINSLKIYYSTGAYFNYQNLMEIERSNEISKKTGYKIKPCRLVKIHESLKFADAIIQIGTKYSMDTYPEDVQNKMIIIRQSSVPLSNKDVKYFNNTRKKTNFMWFSANGAALRGLDLCIEYFETHNDIVLYIAGNVEKDFLRAYKNIISKSSNIKFIGWLEPNSEKMDYYLSICAFLLYPSASEGMSGSVINLAKTGIIPIISKITCYDGFDQFSIIINQINIDDLGKAIRLALGMTDIERVEKSMMASKFVNDNFNLDTFSNDLSNALVKIIEKDGLT
jgi:glycosyltransferase involved in cell wall biosynthesis